MKKYKVAVIGATGMVGQRLVCLLENHPFFTLAALCAGPISAGKPYLEAVKEKWAIPLPIPDYVKSMTVLPSEPNLLAERVDLVFCAVKLPTDEVISLEECLAKSEIAVVSLNSANRLTPDVPMVIPEVNAEHLDVIPAQKTRLHTRRGFIATKCNCALLSFVPHLTPLRRFGLKKISVCTLQAVSGAGKTLETTPNLQANVFPFIGGEEQKCESEPLKIWGRTEDGEIRLANEPILSAQCFRVPVQDGHTAAVSVSFERTPEREEILSCWEDFNEKCNLKLPSSPQKFIRYFDDEDSPQPRFDAETERGMAVCAGRLRRDALFDYKFIGLSHNTLRGAAGGGVLLAELLATKGFLD